MISPDIVHLNSSKAGALGRILKFMHSRKYKNLDFYYTPHGYAFLMLDEPKIKRNIYYFIEKILGILNTETIACGKGEFVYANKISHNSIFINNCVDINYLDTFKTNKINTVDTFYTIGRIIPQKNPELFNKIALSNPNYKFVWIGDGPDRNKLNSNNIEITGWLSHKEVLEQIINYKYFILCSKWEGLPLSLLESMSLGKICFVSNVNGNKEVINNDGILFNDLNEFNDNFNSLLDETKKEFSNNAIKDIKDNYSIDQFIFNYKKVYEKS
ncbi:glycosyltransferase [Lactobacillus sp. S2-2]|uniref:glycosyltransferase n=1 Tax=Lactobacillus sp. S2-2 TaxID=2692917 RepID=UPI001F367D26|nr:glycosyltransferase [Lactobacillus sp. S2-2]MCF6515245.1 glycosyltransferase [Lactobacillus sp. S2-2]